MIRFLAPILFLVAFTAIAQQAEVMRYDVAQGLPQSMVNHVLQDGKGFIWLGTGDGLARFDGHRFLVYKHDPRDSSSLSHNSIWGLARHDEHHLWVGTRSGLDLLDLRTGRFRHIDTGADALNGCWRPLHSSPEAALFHSPLSNDVLTVADGKAQREGSDHSASYVMHFDPRTGTLSQILGLDTLYTRTSTGAEHITLLPHPEGARITDLVDLGERWLILSLAGAWTWNERDGRRPLPPATQRWIARAEGSKHARFDTDGHLWLGLSGIGVLVLDSNLNVERVYPLLPESERPLSITTIQFDAQGNTWVGTDGKGVFVIAPQRIKFGRCMPGQGSPWEPASWFVRGFAQWDEHRVLVSFYQGGLALFDERTRQLEALRLDPAAERALKDMDFQHPFNDRNGLVWGGDLFHVFAIERSTGKLAFAERTPRGNALTLGPDSDAVILRLDGLRSMRSFNGAVVGESRPAPRMLDYLFARGLIPEKFAIDRNWTFLLGQTTIPFQAWRNDAPISIGPYPPSVRFTALLPDTHDAAYITSNDGLYRVDANDLSIKGHWTIHDGLPDQFLYGMLPDNDGTWWISSNKGLSHFDPRNKSFTNYGTHHGSQSTEFNSNAFFSSASGRLYLGGVNGFNHFMPGTVSSDPDSAQVVVVGLTAQDSAIDLATLKGANVFTLPYGRNQLRIELAVLEFSSPEKNRYRYRIGGYSDWIEQPAERPIELTNIPAGTYAVEVSGINGDGLVSAPRTLLTLHVPLPFSASPWAYALGSVLALGTLSIVSFLLYRQRIQRRLQRAEQEMKELRIRARIAQDLHDDLGSGLARITALSRTASRQADRGDDVRAPVVKMTELSQELMHDLRDVVWVNDPRGGVLADLLLRIREHVQDLFEGSPCTVNVDFPDPLPERTIGPMTKRNLYLIAKEAAHNASKYSAATSVSLRFILDASSFTLELCDNGKGAANTTSSGGHGLRNMHARAAELGHTLNAGPSADGGFCISLAGPASTLDL